MPSTTVDTKIINALYTGASVLTLNTTNAPWLSNVVKITRPSLGTGINTRQTYNGAYNGASPGGAVTTLSPGLIYEINSGLTNNWLLPDFTRVPVVDATKLILTFPINQTAFVFDALTIATEQSGTYAATAVGLTNLSYTKNGTAVTSPISLVANDVLVVTGTTASNAKGVLTLTKQ